jgi:hypothetical protein
MCYQIDWCVRRSFPVLFLGVVPGESIPFGFYWRYGSCLCIQEIVDSSLDKMVCRSKIDVCQNRFNGTHKDFPGGTLLR